MARARRRLYGGLPFGLGRVQRRRDARALGTAEGGPRLAESVSVSLSAVVLAAAGLFKFTPLKHAYLAQCRSPWGAVLTLSGAGASIRDGLRYGAYCVGCCGALMHQANGRESPRARDWISAFAGVTMRTSNPRAA